MDDIDPAIYNVGQYFTMPSPGPVPTVDPADLRNVWELMQTAQAEARKAYASLPKTEVEDYARRGISTSWDFRALGLSTPNNVGCSPGADVGAVWYRVMMLGWLDGLRRLSSISLLSEMPDFDPSKPTDAVFKALAVVPMTGLAHSGPTREGFPFDITEFGKLISAAT
jgi:hypothetical protein